MIGNLEIVHDFSTITNKVIITIAENSNPSAEIDRAVLNAPHTAGEVTIFDNLNLVLHRVKCYESTDGTTLESLLHSWTVQVKKSTQIVKVFQYEVGRGNSGTDPNWSDPVAETSSLIDERLSGADKVVLLREGGGLVHENVDYTLKAGGGWDFINGETFSEGEKWTAIATYTVDVTSESSAVATGEDVHVVDTDEDFDTTYYSKNNVADFSGTIGTTTFPAFSLIPNKTKARFSAYTGSQRYWKLQFNAGDTARFNGEDKNVIYLRKNQHIELFFKDGVCYVTYFNSNNIEPGKRELLDRWDFATGNNNSRILLDGSQYSLADYPGFDEDFLSKLAPSQIVTASDWNSDTTKQHYYAIDRVLGIFKVPKDQDMHYRGLKTFDGANGQPGLYTPDAMIDHKHSGTLGTLVSSLWGRLTLLIVGSSTTIGRYNGTMANNQGGVDLTSSPVKTDGSGYVTVGTETAVKAVRQYAAVYI